MAFDFLPGLSSLSVNPTALGPQNVTFGPIFDKSNTPFHPTGLNSGASVQGNISATMTIILAAALVGGVYLYTKGGK